MKTMMRNSKMLKKDAEQDDKEEPNSFAGRQLQNSGMTLPGLGE